MKTLIVEDDITSQLLMRKLLERYGPLQIAEDGKQAVEIVRLALKAGQPFDLICLDIMMPKMDGQAALKEIRAMEDAMGLAPEQRTKVIMTTALADRDNVIQAGRQQCVSYLLKPIDNARLVAELRRLDLIPQEESEEKSEQESNEANQEESGEEDAHLDC